MRANIDPFPVLDSIIEAVSPWHDAVLQINVHDEIFDPHNYWFAPEAGGRLRAYGARPQVDLRIHPYFSDDELWDYLSALTVSVLPYRFGTHSGWLEACFDLGTAVVAPRCGFYGEQRPCETYDFGEGSFDPASLHHALDTLYRRHRESQATARATWRQRRQERAHIAATHRRLYEDVLR